MDKKKKKTAYRFCELMVVLLLYPWSDLEDRCPFSLVIQFFELLE